MHLRSKNTIKSIHMNDITPQKKQDLEQGVNQGVVAPNPAEVLAQGILDTSQFPIVAPDSNIDKFLSDFDPQFDSLFDTLACNIFSSVAMSEVNINSMGGDVDYGGLKVEFSERFSAVKAGLNGLAGSSEQQWENEISNFGLVLQSMWPWTPGLTREQYFQSIPADVSALGLKFLAKYVPFPRSIGTDHSSIIEALKYGAVKIFIGTGSGWNVGEPNVIPITDNPISHAVTVRKIDSLGIHIRDQYPPFLKVLSPTYRIYFAFQTLYKQKTQSSFVFMRDLWYGLTDPDCVHLQMALLNDGEFPAGVAFDEHFGLKTLAAVQKFQVKYGISSPGQPGYGRVGPLTRSKLNLIK